MDILSYIMGLLKGRKESRNVTLDGDFYAIHDGHGNVELVNAEMEANNE